MIIVSFRNKILSYVFLDCLPYAHRLIRPSSTNIEKLICFMVNVSFNQNKFENAKIKFYSMWFLQLYFDDILCSIHLNLRCLDSMRTECVCWKVLRFLFEKICRLFSLQCTQITDTRICRITKFSLCWFFEIVSSACC